MGDIELRPADAIRVLTRLRDGVMAEVRAHAEHRSVPMGWGGFQLWVLKKEEELAVLESCIESLRKLPSSEVVAVAEGTAT